MNRLKLDFSLETAEERKNFIDDYIVQFPDLTATEASTIADYLLWGKDNNGVAVGVDLDLETKWSREENSPDSLDAVLESPSASHIYVRGLNLLFCLLFFHGQRTWGKDHSGLLRLHAIQ